MGAMTKNKIDGESLWRGGRVSGLRAQSLELDSLGYNLNFIV